MFGIHGRVRLKTTHSARSAGQGKLTLNEMASWKTDIEKESI
jgi:hypothetical protein